MGGSLATLARLSPPFASRFTPVGHPLAEVRLEQVSLYVQIDDPSTGDRIADAAPGWYVILALLGALWLIFRVLRRGTTARPFDWVGASDLRRLGIYLTVVGTLYATVRDRAANHLVTSSPLHGAAHVATRWSLTYLVFGLVLLAISEAWRHGAALDDDVAATI